LTEPDFRVVERLDAQSVAGYEQFFAALVPERETEHAAHLLHAAHAVFLVQMNDDLGIRGGIERVAKAFEFAALLGAVVKLAVENYPDRAIFVMYRLATRVQIDDAQASHTEADTVGEIKAVVIGASMDHRGAHPAQLIQPNGSSVQTSNTCNATHRPSPRSLDFGCTHWRPL
jgi:hypothetical protein